MNDRKNIERLAAEAKRMKEHFDAIDREREGAYKQARELRRMGTLAVREIHKGRLAEAKELLAQSGPLARELSRCSRPFGFIEEALQEYAEAAFTLSFVEDAPAPTAEELGVNERGYLTGLADAIGELRRHALDLMRRDDLEGSQNCLNLMDDLFSILIQFDHTDAVLPLRNKIDQNRGIIERTRGDITAVICQKRLERTLAARIAEENA